MSVPSSVIYILSDVPLNNSYEHSLYFPSKDKQEAYFLGYHREKTFDKFTYLRPENAIKVAGDIANAQKWNYLMFKNADGKWFYHFITRVEYTSDNSVKLHIELDVLQTFMFDWNMQQCFIERNHTATDDIGHHTIDEGLDCGELIDANVVDYMFDDMCILMLSAVDDAGNSAWSKMYNGVFSGLAIHAIDPDDYADFGEWLDDMSGLGKIDAIVAMWMYPKNLVSVVGGWDNGAIRHTVQGFSPIDVVTIDDKITSTIDGYTPKNNKVFTYPYTMLYVSNNTGGSAVFRRERFDGDEFKFKLMGALSPECGVQLIPYSYNGLAISYEHGVSIGAFPSCSWDSDTYKVWLAQNQHTLEAQEQGIVIQGAMGLVGGGAGTVGGLASGNYVGAMGSALGTVGVELNALQNMMNLVAQKKDMSVQPPQARGKHSSNINLANGRCGFSFHFKTVTGEQARVIDNFFSRYGYKVNKIEKPSLCNRERFTYVKTQGCWVTGELGTENQLKIQAIFDKGVTWWNDHNSIGNFTSANPCL